MRDVTPEIIRRLLEYDPLTGRLTWKERDLSMFSPPKRAASWNAQNAGKEAFTATSNGYKCGRIFNKSYQAQRVIWAHVHGAWPSNDIDHVNGRRDDNRIENLRDVPNSENHKNMRMRADNSSGVTGVSWFKRYSKWNASIHVNGKRKNLGYFANIDEAAAARRAAEVANDFHPNHGKAAA